MGKLIFRGKYFSFFWHLSSVILFIVLALLLKELFFFHDEWTFIYKIISSPKEFIFSPYNGHFMPLFNLVYYLAYQLFGLNYALYELVLLVFHFINAYLLYGIIRSFSGQRNLGVAGFFLFLCCSIYWEVLFSFSTFPTVLCLTLMAFSLFSFLQWREKGKGWYLVMAAFFSSVSSFAWGAGLLSPSIFLAVILTQKIIKQKVYFREILVFLLAQVISLGTYFLVAKQGTVFNLKKIVVFWLTAIKWVTISFYVASPGLNKIFLALMLTFLVILVVTLRGDKKRVFKKKVINQSFILLFSLFAFGGIYVLSAISRYQIDMALAKSSRYTYIPLYFFIILNFVILDGLSPLFSRLIKRLLLSYLIILILANFYFFKIYYHSWLETISLPNEIIFWQISQTPSAEERKKIFIPTTFHDFYRPEEIYFISRHLVKESSR